MRSYYLSTGNKEFKPQLSMVPESQLTRDSHEGYNVEGNVSFSEHRLFFSIFLRLSKPLWMLMKWLILVNLMML